MQYMIMLFGDGATMQEVRSPEWIKEMIDFMIQVDEDLKESGELVVAHGLAFPGAAKTVRIENGMPVTMDGPFAEADKSLAGFWIVDVESEARAIEISSQVVEYAGAVEVRQVVDEPPNL